MRREAVVLLGGIRTCDRNHSSHGKPGDGCKCPECWSPLTQAKVRAVHSLVEVCVIFEHKKMLQRSKSQKSDGVNF